MSEQHSSCGSNVEVPLRKEAGLIRCNNHPRPFCMTTNRT
jgi:hypothetical protein